jgi:mono/diheme cytochrome c family protein
MTPHRASLALLLSVLAAPPPSPAAALPDLERGRRLYDNHCQVCHTPKVHGRVPRLPIDRADLRAIVNAWQRSENLRWNEQDVEDVTEFLNRTRYRFAP